MSEYPGKRIVDLTLTLVALPVWLPALAIIAIIVRASLGSPVFFVQQRPGLHGRSFPLIKFRTMSSARDASGQLLPDRERLTRVGRALRALSLDELPELLNVLRGEMSLVGPRPLLTKYLSLYNERHRHRHDVRPGMTGLAQVSGRNALTWEQKFDLDIEYVARCSLALDLKILLRTMSSVVRREGISAQGEATMPEFTGYGRE